MLGLKYLLKEGLTPEAAGGKLSSEIINSIGKDYAEVIAHDPEITGPGGVLDKLAAEHNVGRGSAGFGEAYRKTLSASPSEGVSGGGEKAVDPALLAKTADRVRSQISESKIKKSAAPPTEAEGDTSFEFGANVKPETGSFEIASEENSETGGNSFRSGLD